MDEPALQANPSDPGDSALDAEAGSVWLTKAGLAAARGISIDSADRLIRRMRWRRQPGNDGRVLALIPAAWAKPRADRPGDHLEAASEADPEDGTTAPPGSPTDSRTVEARLAAIEAAHAAETDALRTRLDAAESGRLGAQGLAETLAAQLADAGERANRVVALLADVEARVRAADDDRRTTEGRAERAEAAKAAERARADMLRDRLVGAQAELSLAQTAAERARADAREALQTVEALRQTDEARKARGRLRRAWDGWRGR